MSISAHCLFNLGHLIAMHSTAASMAFGVALILKVGYSPGFFSIPHAVAHAEALILHVAQKTVNPVMLATHQITLEWTDGVIDKVVDNRAGLIGKGRNRK